MPTKTTHIAIVLDASSSMGDYRFETEKAYNDLLASIKENSAKIGGNTTLMRVEFADTACLAQVALPVNSCSHIIFRPYGNTAMFAGIEMALNELTKLGGLFDPDTAFLMYVITDGEENRSVYEHRQQVLAKIAAAEKTGQWTIAFQVPRGKKAAMVTAFQVPAANIMEWETTRRGMEVAAVAQVQATHSYFVGRSQGATRSTSMYVTPDMSKVDTQTIKEKLNDVSDRFKAYTVGKEARVNEFTEGHTKKPYVIGQTYYQLMKSEKIQPTKHVLIMEKGKRAVWGGDAARQLIGLPPYSANTPARVKPGNHANYEIYVQSASTNRILPRGTKVMVDTTMQTGVTPTWDHTTMSNDPNSPNYVPGRV